MKPTNLHPTESPDSEKAGPSKTKLALAATLGLVFVIVVAVRVIEFIGGDETTLADQPSPAVHGPPPSRTDTGIRRRVSRSESPRTDNARREISTTETTNETGNFLPDHTVDVSRLLEFNPFHPDAEPATSPDSVTRPPSIAERTAEAHSESPPGLLDHAVRWVERRVSSLTASDVVGTVEQVGELVLPDSPEPPGVEVAAIMTGGNRPAALIGDELYFENDRLDDRWKVVKINANGVVVELTASP